MHSTTRSVLCALALGLCGCAPDAQEAPRAAAVEREAPAPAAPAQEGEAAGGGFRVVYTGLRDERFAEWEAFVREARILEGSAEVLNDWIVLPHDVELTFAACGEANAFYEPDRKHIVVCYEILEHFGEVFADAPTDEFRAQAMLGATDFVLYHELGHALIDVLDLPVLGREEDAADQLAAYVLTNDTDEGEQAALNGVVALGAGEEVDETAFADTHSLGPQRFYNVACWVYGQNPEKHADFVSDDFLPAWRAEGCPEEYARVESSWSRLLEPHLRRGS
ncbi:MAG TPA: DUF4344 domain-containing metallopeptidase [Longimicrobiaceae bacterium]